MFLSPSLDLWLEPTLAPRTVGHSEEEVITPVLQFPLRCRSNQEQKFNPKLCGFTEKEDKNAHIG